MELGRKAGGSRSRTNRRLGETAALIDVHVVVDLFWPQQFFSGILALTSPVKLAHTYSAFFEMQLWPVETVMTIACLGWGSLIWRNDGLRCDGNWRADGPLLPIEFARMSQGGEVTLVILDGVPAVPVLWSGMEVPTLAAAAENLRVREGGRGANGLALGHATGDQPHRIMRL